MSRLKGYIDTETGILKKKKGALAEIKEIIEVRTKVANNKAEQA